MQANVDGIDRIVRIMLGIALILFALLSKSEYRWWGLLHVVPLFTAFVRRCPVYLPLGISTCRKS